MLQIRLLGQFDIRLDKKRITITSRVAQSLFAYLALTAGTAHRREKLAGTFWPDTPEENGRKNLRQELWRIRKALSSGSTDAVDYLLANEYSITFNRNAAYWLDVAQLEKPDADLEELTRSLSLYQGELLPGFYEDWILLERERIQSLFDIRMGQLLERLIESEHGQPCRNRPNIGWLLEIHRNQPSAPSCSPMRTAAIWRRSQLCTGAVSQNWKKTAGSGTFTGNTCPIYEGLIKGSHKASQQAALPAGTITFLFTDIEGSTNLLDSLGDQYASVLETHHEIMRRAILKWNGKEVDTQGDAILSRSHGRWMQSSALQKHNAPLLHNNGLEKILSVCGWACTPASLCSPRPGMLVWMSTARPHRGYRSWRAGTALANDTRAGGKRASA